MVHECKMQVMSYHPYLIQQYENRSYLSTVYFLVSVNVVRFSAVICDA